MLRPEIPDVEPLPAHLQMPGSDPSLLEKELLWLIGQAIEQHPRTLQVELGPSEIGHTCARRIGYAMLGTEENASEPNWKATVGTAVHSWLEDVFTAANSEVRNIVTGPEARFLTETRVSVGELGGVEIRGHCDLFDRVTGTVVDWKCVGPTQLKRYRTKGPGDQYRRQAHLYGRGWTRRGQRVERVAVMFLPRDGALREAHYWSEPYDEAVALEALQRAEGIVQATRALGPRALDILPTADAWCRMCPYFKARSEDLTQGCPGDPATQRTPTPALSLG